MTRIALALAAVCAAGSALATEGLEWDWEGQTHRYLLRADVQLSEMMWLRPTLTRQTTAAGFAVDVVTTCAPDRALGKRGWQMRCSMDDLSIRFDPDPTDEGPLAAFAQELDDTFTGHDVLFTMLRDGRIRALEIEGVDKFQRRIDQFHEDYRQMLLRVFATLELRLPRKGDDRGIGVWENVGGLQIGFASQYGTVGRATVDYRLMSEEAGQVQLETSGGGVVGTGEVTLVAGVERMANPYEMGLVGVASFDHTGGFLVEQSYVVRGVPAASARIAESAVGEYVQRCSAKHLDADLVVELPASGEHAMASDPDNGDG